MTTPSSPTNPPPAEPVVPVQPILAPDAEPIAPWQRWLKFWFPKSDPTTLGFIRICTGLLVLYIHFAYSLDLQAFFGKHAWYATSFIDRERKEGPYYTAPFFGGWDDNYALMQLSEFPHRRQAFIEFFRGLPANTAEREQSMKYINRLNGFKNPEDFILGMRYVENIKTDPKQLNNYLTVLTDGKLDNEVLQKTCERYTPSFLLALPLEDRIAIAGEVRAFWTALSKIEWSNPIDGRNYVFNYLQEVPQPTRKAIINFINTLPEDPAKRKELIDYVEYWNNDPRNANRLGHGIFSLWFHVTDPTQMALVHTGVLIVIFLFTIGLFTRVTSVLVWVATVSYIHRTQQILFGMDTMMNILLIYLMVGNSGAALSIDRLIARYRAARASLRRCGSIDPNTRAFLAYPPPSMNTGFALRLIQVHFCFIYMAAGLSKLKGGAWWDGRAFWDVVANPEFTMMSYSWYENTLKWLASIKWLYYTVTISVTWLTLFTEIGSPFLLWTRLRWFMILVATAMHAVIGILMGLNLFELLMIVMLLAFFPDRVIRDRFRGGVDLVRLMLAYNPQNQQHAKAAALVLAADIDNQVALNPDRNAEHVSVATEPDGKSETGTSGVSLLFQNLRMLPVLSFVLWIPGIKSALARVLFSETDSVKSGSNSKQPTTPMVR